MIWTFTPNPALDITWQAPDQTRGQTSSVSPAMQQVSWGVQPAV